jgi:hypothetical protein
MDQTDSMETEVMEDESGSPRLTLASVIRVKHQARLIKHRIEYKKAEKSVLHPNGKPKLFWDCCNLLLLIYSTFQIPYSVAFLSNSCDLTDSAIINLAVDCFFLCDIILNFFVGYIDEETGILEVSKIRIAQHYIRSWFIFDFISSLPWDRIFCSLTTSQTTKILKVFRIIKIVRFVRMLRIAGGLQEFIGNWAKDSIRLVKFVGILLLFGHICACFWFLIIDVNSCQIPADQVPSGSVVCGCDQLTTKCQDWNWLAKYDAAIYSGNSTEARYLASVYYAIVTLTTVGYGDVLPTNQAERGLSSALALCGAVAFSFLISNISGLVSKGNSVEVREILSITRTHLVSPGRMAETVSAKLPSRKVANTGFLP